MTISFRLDGVPVSVPADARTGLSLLDALRDQLLCPAAKDGCSPQGQCGCCTVWVDGQPRVACVTPLRRVEGRSVTTVDGLAATIRDKWADAFVATGGSQCGFCTPGIVMRLEALRSAGGSRTDIAATEQALLAHLCRCTGWQTILETWCLVTSEEAQPVAISRDLSAAADRARIEGGVAQRVGPAVALGRGGFAADELRANALVAVPDSAGGWALGETLAEARAAAGKVQGRRSTVPAMHPLEVPPGSWPLTLRTTWVEPGYLETDASFCEPGGEPSSPLANGGAFGGKANSAAAAAARTLAQQTGRPVRVLFAREDTVRLGPKRPPLSAGIDPQAGRMAIAVARTPGVVAALRAGIGPGIDVDITEVDVPGPPTSLDLRAAGWAEGAVLRTAVVGWQAGVLALGGGRARAAVEPDGTIAVWVNAGDPLDLVVLRSYCVGAAHMAAGWVTSERIAVDAAGDPLDLTVRSFGILRAIDTPNIRVEIEPSDEPPVPGSDAVFAAVAAAVWAHQGHPRAWPTGVRLR